MATRVPWHQATLRDCNSFASLANACNVPPLSSRPFHVSIHLSNSVQTVRSYCHRQTLSRTSRTCVKTQRRRWPQLVEASSEASAESAASASPPGSPQLPRRVSAPSSLEESTEQAIAGVLKAIGDGRKLQQLELLLPLVAPSLLDDWPGGIQQQLQAATPLVTKILKGVSGDSESNLKKTMLNEEDAVLLIESSKANLVVFPTADVLPTLKKLAQGPLPLLMVNPQWQPGQVISDLGFGAAKRESEAFLSSFVVSYALKSNRVRGSLLTLVRSYPSDWCVYVQRGGQGSLYLAGSQPERPTYKELEGYVKAAENNSVTGSPSFFERLAKEFQFIKDSK